MTYTLTATDEAVISSTLNGVTVKDVPRLVRAHEEHIGRCAAERRQLLFSLAGIDRAVAVREEAIRRLRALGGDDD